MKSLALTLALIAAGPALAQGVPASVLPLEVGNRWEYVVFNPSGTLTWEVVGDTTIAGERIARMQFDGSAVCGVRTVQDPATPYVVSFRLVRLDDIGERCDDAPASFPNEHEVYDRSTLFVYAPPSARSVQIGDTAVTGDVWRGPLISPGTGIHYQEALEVLGGIGMFSFQRTVGGTGNPQTEVLRYRLNYARVRGVAYGHPFATAGAEVPGAAATALTVGPNPVRIAATLRFTASTRPAEARLADALGRTVRRVAVPAGATEARLDVRGLAAGVYVATVGSASVRLVVAR